MSPHFQDVNLITFGYDRSVGVECFSARQTTICKKQ